MILTEKTISTQIKIDNYCRKNNIKFISADVYGPWARHFNDFGDKFEVIDKNGDDPVELVIENISNEEKGVVTLIKGSKHPYEDGESIIINGVEGMDEIDD